MPDVIDLGSELLVDWTTVRVPELRLWLAAMGKPLAADSAWIVIGKGLSPFPASAARWTTAAAARRR